MSVAQRTPRLHSRRVATLVAGLGAAALFVPLVARGDVVNGNFEAGDTEYFVHADNADLSTGDVDFTFACLLDTSSTSPGAWLSWTTDSMYLPLVCR